MVMYVRLPCNQDGSRKSYTQRSAERRQQDAERRAQQRSEPIGRDPIFDLPYQERRSIRRAEAQGREEAKHRAAITEQAKRQAEFDALPEHERRPPNHWRNLIELRKKDAWRREVAHRIKVYEQEAEKEDERIDALMAEKKRRFELESSPEYERAIDHLERVSQCAESEERETLARLRGTIEGGDFAGYWRDCQPLMEARLQKIRQRMEQAIGKQAAVVGESKAIAEELAAAEDLQVKQKEAPVESGEPTQQTGETQ